MHLLWTYTKLVWSSFGLCHASVMNKGTSKMGDFWVKIRSQWQGRSGAGIHCGNSLAPQITSILIGKHGLGPFWPLPSSPRVHGGGAKRQFVRSKSGNNGRVIQGPWNHHENSLTPQITSVLMGIHDLGPLWPLPPSLPVHGGGQKWLILRSKSGHNGRVTQEPWNQRGNSWTPQMKTINRKTWIRATLTPAILLPWARGGQKWPILRSKSGHNGKVTQGPWNNVETLYRLKSYIYW